MLEPSSSISVVKYYLGNVVYILPKIIIKIKFQYILYFSEEH